MAKRFRFTLIKDLLGEKDEPSSGYRGGMMTETQKAKKNKRFSSGGSRSGFGGGGYRYFSKSYSDSPKQNCIFKSKHRYNKELNHKHFHYIQREGVGADGQRPELYGADPDNYEKRASKLHFRFIISPENQNVDLRLLTEEFMRSLEEETGYRLDWVAADHYNTGRKHTHILINGFDLKKRKVEFNRNELSHLIREKLKDLCTDQVGSRSREERQESLQRMAESKYFTALDKRLDNLLDGSDSISLYKLHRLEGNAVLLHNRVMQLKELGLARYDQKNEQFIFPPGWQDSLKTIGKYNTFLNGLELTGAHPSRYSLHNIDLAGPVTGKVKWRYFMQEESNCHAVVLETRPGEYVYVPLHESPDKCAVGQNITIAFQQIQTPSGGTRKVMEITPVH